MKRRIVIAAPRCGLGFLLLACSLVAYGAEDGFAQWAATHAVPIATVESTHADSDLMAIESAIGTASLVALDEPMHGAHEPLAFRNRLFRHLVERMGFTAIAFETGFTESISARAFIEEGRGDAETAARNGMGIGFGRYAENHALFQWMRDYNAAAAADGRRKLRFYGIDMTAWGRKNGPWLAIDSALTFLSRGDAATARKIRDALGSSLAELDAREFGALPADAQARFESSIEAIAKAMQESRTRLIEGSSAEEYRWALQNLEAARQLAECLPITPPPGADANLWARATACRDERMAANVRWALENEGRQGRLLVFAHNGHVMNMKEDGRRMANVREKPSMMGLHLRRAYGDDLYIVGLVCATTSGGLLAARALEEGSIEGTLAGRGLPLMFLDVRAARRHNEALPWLSMRRSVNANVSAQWSITLSDAVDGFVFVETLTPAVVASRQAP